MKIYTIDQFCELSAGAEIREFELANKTKIPAIWVGEKGRGREVGLMPVKNINLETGKSKQINDVAIGKTLAGKPCFIASEKQQDSEESYVLVAGWESGFRGSGSNYIALKGINSFLAWNKAYQTWIDKVSDAERASVYKECENWQGLTDYIYMYEGSERKKMWLTEAASCFLRIEREKLEKANGGNLPADEYFQSAEKIIRENNIPLVESEKYPEVEKDVILKSSIAPEWAKKHYQKQIKKLVTGNKAQGAAGHAGDSEQSIMEVPFNTIIIYHRKGRTYGNENKFVYYITKDKFVGLPYSEFLMWLEKE